MNAEAVLDLFRAVILAAVLLSLFRFIGLEKFSARLVFFSLAIACILLTDLYWLSYDILRPEVRMPFAANEFGEWALFLLLGAALSSGHPIRFQEAGTELLCTVLFAAANVGLWIGWSGEWVQDVLTGLSVAYFLCALVSQIKQEHAFSRTDWRLLGLLCTILIAAQTATFFVPEGARRKLDLCCYLLLFAAAAVFLFRAARSILKDTDPAQGVCHAFAAFAWVIITMYMSEGTFYPVSFALSAICFPLMYLALKKEVTAV